MNARVLLGVEHFEQRRRGIAAIVLPELVDFVEQDHRVHDLGATHRLNDATRHRADVRAPVPANLGFVAHAAQRHADELASERARDRAAERCLADARRSDEAENRSFDPPTSDSTRDVVEDAILHFLETVVILVENRPRVRDVEDVVGALGPRKRDDPVDEVARRPWIRETSATCGAAFAARAASRVFTASGSAFFVDLRLELGEVVAVLLAELAVNRLELLLEVELALILEQRAAHVVVDLSLETQQLDLARERARRAPRAGPCSCRASSSV